MAYQDKNFNYIDAEAYDKRSESSVLENYVLGLWQPFLKEKIKNLSVDKTMIDFGCGTGEYTQVAVAARKIYAVDVSEQMLKVCREKLKNFPQAEIIKSTGFDVDFPKVDLILTIGIWEYVDPELLLNKIKKIIKSGGKVMVVFPNIYNKLNFARFIFGRKPKALRPGFMKNIFEKDFKILETNSFGIVFWWPKKIQFIVLPIWKFFELLWGPFQKFIPLGVNVYYLFERK
jgi:SAM-dependent methyltransferase